MRGSLAALVAVGVSLASSFAWGQPTFLTFESGHVRPLAVSPDESRLFAVNTPDGRLEVFDIGAGGVLARAGQVEVGMEPVAVAARTNDEVWVVNTLSDSVSVVDLSGVTPRVVRTLLVGDEPSDIVFAGPGGNRAFITTAHRGQNSPFPRSEYATPGVGRADVWVFDATNLGSSLGGDPLTIITLFSDKPRALAVSPDGATVYAAAFRSGNRTTAINEALVCNTSGSNINNDVVQGACNIGGASMPGGIPLPHKNHQGIGRPETGLIVKLDRDGGASNQWQDELDRNWNNAVNFSLPDEDVFTINANLSPPAQVGSPYQGVGTVLFNMVVNPVSGKVYVTNTDAQNHVRFEGPGTLASGFKPAGEPATVRGNLAQARITVLDGGSVLPRHLNKHIPYGSVPMPTGVKQDSLATPLGMAISSTGSTLYVAAFGSSKIGVFDTAELESDTFVPNAADHIVVGGGGPSGLALVGNRLYVTTRFDNAVRVVNVSTGATVQTLSLHNPEPASVVDGRPFLYDALLTGSNGEASCSSCHIFGDMDDLAWDLGNPDDDQVANNNPFNPVIPAFADPLPRVFHPMKGPMTTQSLRGLANMGAEHWRGDRQGNENAAFNAFNVAFPGLVGRDEGELSTSEMQAFTDFALQVRYPPNPIRQLDNSLRSDELAGANLFSGPISDTVANCGGCHVLNPAAGFFGGNGQSTFEGETQHFKVPHLRNAYQKVGMFGLPSTPGLGGPFVATGDQVRGFGFLHDGSVDTVTRFLSSSVFALNSTEEDQLEAFIMAFDSDLAPIVGQQVTLTDTNGAVAEPRVDFLIQRAEATFVSEVLGGTVTECDLIVKGVVGGEQRGAVYLNDGTWQTDRIAEPLVPTATLKGLASVAGQELTFTCTPPGSGIRAGIDRDEDGFLDRDELDAGSDPGNPGSVPGATTTTTTSPTTTSTAPTTTSTGGTTTTTGATTTTTSPTTTTSAPTTSTTSASTTTTVVTTSTTTTTLAPAARTCLSKKAKAAGQKAKRLLKAYGRDQGSPNVLRLNAEISKAQSKFTKDFSKAEAAGGCAVVGDVSTVEASVDAFVEDIVSDVVPSPSGAFIDPTSDLLG